MAGRFLLMGLASRRPSCSTCQIPLSQLDGLHVLTLATMPVLHGPQAITLDSTTAVSFGPCASFIGDSFWPLFNSPSPDAGVRQAESTCTM